jgi:uncharacterized protein
MSQQKGASEILQAVYQGKHDVVAALLAAGVSLDIFEAAATGQTSQIQTLVEQDPSLVNTYSPDGFTPLGLATFFGHAQTVDALLAARAEVNAAYRETMKLTPLGSAMAIGRNDIARTLIDHGADVNASAVSGHRPLHTAAARGNLESATLLLDNGADINATTTDGKTALAYAEEHEHPEMVKLLQQRT